MKKFILFLIFLFLLILQQSNFVEKVKVYDAKFGVNKEEYRINWNNLTDYFENIKERGFKLIPKKYRP